MADWYGLAAVDVVKLLRSSEMRGLNSDEVIENRKKYGENKIVAENKKEFILDEIKDIFEPWLIVLVFCSIIFLYAGKFDVFLVGIVLAAVYLILIAHFAYKRYKDIKSVERFNLNMCSVLRGGRLTKVKADELVVGDIVNFSKGDIIPCEIRILECDKLKINEVNVTGDESIVEKFSAKIGGDNLPVSEMRNMLFKSSVVVQGEGEGVVVAVGMNTEFGKIMSSFLKIEKNENILMRKVQRLINVFSAISAVVSIVLVMHSGQGTNSLNTAAMVCISGVPVEIIFILYEISIAIKKYLKRENIILKSFFVIERLSKVDAVCLEKEDALTRNEMFIKKIYDGTDTRYADNDMEWNDNIERIVNIGILCNDYNPQNQSNLTLDIAERSIADYVQRRGIDVYEVKGIKRVFEIPYDADKRIKTTVNKIDRKYRANVKGAVDVILDKCTHVMVNGIEKEISPETINDIKLADIEMSSEGLYVMAFAYRNFKYKPTPDENIESNLVFAGLVGFDNPIKDDFKYVYEKCQINQIKPVIFTEDSRLTSEAVGKKVGILKYNNSVISGVEMDNMLQDEFERNIENISMYSRVTNVNKERIVKTLKTIGYNIIMCGSKLMELPALEEANLFIASGKSCNKIVRKLSDIYFIDNDLGKIIKLIEDSKKLIVTLSNIIKNLLVQNMSLLIIMVICAFKGIDMPLNIYEILWIIFINININSAAILSNHRKVSVEYDYEVEKENLWNINVGFTLVGSAFVALLSFLGYYYLNDLKQQTNSINFIFDSLIFVQIVYTFINRFEKNIYFYLILIFNVFIESMVTFTGLSEKMFGALTMTYYDALVLGVILACEIIILSIKKVFSA